LRGGIFHSEDVLLYGANGVIPRREPLLKLHDLATKYLRSLAWAHVSLASLVVAQREGRIVGKLTELIYSKLSQDFIGVEVGIETGSPRLAERIMPGKSAPFPPSKYPEIVEEAFAIMHEHRIIPAATFILNFPGETPEDVVKTVELLEKLRQYRSIIVPMIFVPMGRLKGEREVIARVKIRREHVDAMKVALEHSLTWAERIMREFYLKGWEQAPVRLLLKYFVRMVRWRVAKVLKSLENFTEKELVIPKL